jgi:hypothetical protein
LALDELRDGDEEFHEQGITFLVTRDLFEQIKPVFVDFVETDRGSGFLVTSSLDDGEGGGCGGACSC